jgi:hypothetical protein
LITTFSGTLGRPVNPGEDDRPSARGSERYLA